MKSSSTASSNDLKMPALKIATKVTSARPIISAEAVEAVRDGFRVALSRARIPGAPPIDRAGAPSTAASGRTTREAFIETPKKSRITPTPSARRRGPVAIPVPSVPRETSATAIARTTSAVTGPYLAKRDTGSTEPSRTAAIGGTRVARRAGRMLAISVTIVPTSSETITVRVANTVCPCGRSIPKVTNNLLSPFARARPRKSPITEPTTPMTNASMTTDHSTCRREAPSVRSVANSRIRCAMVMERVFAITKAPTKSAIPANASRMYCRNAMSNCFLSSFTCALASRTTAVGGSSGWI